jgi:hypothetical protein
MSCGSHSAKPALTVAYGSLTPSTAVAQRAQQAAAAPDHASSNPRMQRSLPPLRSSQQPAAAQRAPPRDARRAPARPLAGRGRAERARAACVGHALPCPPMAARPLVARAPCPLATARSTCRACSRKRLKRSRAGSIQKGTETGTRPAPAGLARLATGARPVVGFQ